LLSKDLGGVDVLAARRVVLTELLSLTSSTFRSSRGRYGGAAMPSR
jgi:hypothetical protein